VLLPEVVENGFRLDLKISIGNGQKRKKAEPIDSAFHLTIF